MPNRTKPIEPDQRFNSLAEDDYSGSFHGAPGRSSKNVRSVRGFFAGLALAAACGGEIPRRVGPDAGPECTQATAAMDCDDANPGTADECVGGTCDHDLLPPDGGTKPDAEPPPDAEPEEPDMGVDAPYEPDAGVPDAPEPDANLDPDDDGLIGDDDPCPETPANEDPDGDCIGEDDGCPYLFDPEQSDPDDDGLTGPCDPCPANFGILCSDPLADADGDGVPFTTDNCELYNPDQADTNGNGLGDICEEEPDAAVPDAGVDAEVPDAGIPDAPAPDAAPCNDNIECSTDYLDSSGNCLNIFDPPNCCGGQYGNAMCQDQDSCTYNFCNAFTDSCVSIPIVGCEPAPDAGVDASPDAQLPDAGPITCDDDNDCEDSAAAPGLDCDFKYCDSTGHCAVVLAENDPNCCHDTDECDDLCSGSVCNSENECITPSGVNCPQFEPDAGTADASPSPDAEVPECTAATSATDCDDEDPCTAEECVDGACDSDPLPPEANCCHDDIECTDTEHTGSCLVNNTCQLIPATDVPCVTAGDCPNLDSNVCTPEECVGGVCDSDAADPNCCLSTLGDPACNDAGETGYCVDNVCETDPLGCWDNAECNDVNPCTIDDCEGNTPTVAGNCEYTAIAGCCSAAVGDVLCRDAGETGFCLTNNTCQLDPNACWADSQCGDANACTTDACVGAGITAGECDHTPVPACCNANADCTAPSVCLVNHTCSTS